MNQPLGLNDITLKTISIYPNPARNHLNIRNTNSIQINSIRIYDVLGRLVLSEEENVEIIDLSHLNSGVLFVEIETDQGVIIKKVVKE